MSENNPDPDPRPESDPASGVVGCPECDRHELVDDPNEAVAMYDRHHAVTGHEMAWERTALDVDPDVDGEAGVEGVLDALGDDYEEGVPVGVLTAAMADRDTTIAETLAEVYDLRMSGGLYEPRDDHLSTV